MSLYDVGFLIESTRSDGDTLEVAAFFCGKTTAAGTVFGKFVADGYEDTLTDNT